MSEPARRDPWVGHAAALVGLSAVGLVLAAAVPGTAEARLSALVGVAGSVVGGAVALGLKRRAAMRSLERVMGAIGVVFALRTVLAIGGVLFVAGRGLEVVYFVVGYFGTYFPLQWVEISYVLAALRGRGGRGA